MDAQNVVDSTTTKEAGSPSLAAGESSGAKNPVTASSPVDKNKSSGPSSKPSPATKDAKSAANPPTSTNAPDDDPSPDRDSEAETIVLPGKDGVVSPSKSRKVIKHEDKSDGEISDAPPAPPSKNARDDRNEERADDAATASGKKRKAFDKEKPRTKDGSSGLSSAPASPPAQHRNPPTSHRRRRSGDARSGSDSDESAKPRSPKLTKDKQKSVDRVLSNKRKALKAESDDENEQRKVRRPRISDPSIEASSSRHHKDSRPSSGKTSYDKNSATRSVSPHARTHRRSNSTQLPSTGSNGFSTKKRRPAPLQSTEYHSDDSSASGSPHPRSSKLRSLATPVTGDSTMSPAKMAPHKKHLDAHGQTLFAKACAKGEYDVAKTRLQERPEDLDFADHAGNTPLQVASLNGHEDIVQLLIDAGCNLECKNDVKDTPLLDAVENGHLGVVKLLLAAGVNPRKPNAEGQEPLEKIPDDLENAEEIRAAITEAKQKIGELRRTSEDHLPQDNADSGSVQGLDSPRQSPAASVSGLLSAASRRGGAVRSTKTSNHLLYMSLDEKTLRQAAARGDQETVTRILQVKESCDDPEALVAAARGGHNFVMELLLALGGANPDPAPVVGLPMEHGTPMLAAIGQENTKVIQLLLNQSGFDPTRRFKGETYYEIARRREGPMWKEEEDMLKNAYDDYKKHNKGSKNKSPARREIDQEAKRASRVDPKADSLRAHKRRQSSPPREAEIKKKVSSTKISGSPRQKRRSLSFGNEEEQISPKRGPGRPRKEERVPTITVSDREASPVVSAKNLSHKTKRTESDLGNGSSDGEAAKPRRKLISGKDLKGREKQRRASMVSNNSAKEASDRSDARHDEASEKSRADRISEKYHDRTKALKRDESKDRVVSGDGSVKRHRSSVTPPRTSSADKHDGEAPVKRRRLDVDGKDRQRQGSSPDGRLHKRDVSRDPPRRSKTNDPDRKEPTKLKKSEKSEKRESDRSSPSEKGSITVASEDHEIEMRDAPPAQSKEELEAQARREAEEKAEKQAEAEAAAKEELKKKKEEEARRQEEEKRVREEEERKLQEAAEKQRAEEEEEKLRLEEEKKRKEAEAEAEKLRLELERKQREEEERKRAEEEEKRRKEEAERRKREEEERVRREKEAAEEARRVREEEERKERERKRAAREAELLRIRQEQERIRLAKLPPLLRWLDGCSDPKQTEIAELFAVMQGVRYDTIRPSATGAPDGREQWLLNTQVALLLGEKDTMLTRYTAWERIQVTPIAKRVIWRLEQDRYALTEGKLYHLGEQLSDYYGGDPSRVGYRKLEQLRGEASRLFFQTDMFFVRASDFLYIVPKFPHLRNVKLSICYRELPEHESQLMLWSSPAKWKQDPNAARREGFAPGNQYYLNGQFIGEEEPGHYKPSKEPFPERRVPRRGGIVAVGPEEHDYARLCMEQGLSHLLTEQQKMTVTNGAHLTPRSMTSNDPTEGFNGALSPSSTTAIAQANGNGIHESTEVAVKPLVNGINGTSSDGGH